MFSQLSHTTSQLLHITRQLLHTSCAKNVIFLAIQTNPRLLLSQLFEIGLDDLILASG